MVDDNRAIFMFKDGSQAWEAKDFLVEQERCKDVTIDSKVYEGKKAAKVGLPSRTLRPHYRLYHRHFMKYIVVVQNLRKKRDYSCTLLSSPPLVPTLLSELWFYVGRIR